MAYMWHAEDRMGSLSIGKLANMAVFDKNFLEGDIEDIAWGRCLATTVDGEGEDYEVLSDFLDQYWFNAPLIRAAENQVKAGGKTYVYYFRVESSVPLMKSGHAIELSELFNHPEETFVTGRQFDKTFSKTMRKMWVQFAKCGDPALPAEESPDGKAKEWPAYQAHASVFEDATNVFMPYYRQAGFRFEGETWQKTGNVENAISGMPYDDIADVGADAQVVPERGVIVTNAASEPVPEELAAAVTPFLGPGGRHASDYSYYYNNIKDNVARRIATYKASH